MKTCFLNLLLNFYVIYYLNMAKEYSAGTEPGNLVKLRKFTFLYILVKKCNFA